jgi:laminin gamma 1
MSGSVHQVRYKPNSETIDRGLKFFFFQGKFLGNQRKSYNQDMRFELKFRKDLPKLTRKDILLENNQFGLKVYKQLNYESFDENKEFQQFSIKLKETDGWIPSMSAKDFQRLLSNLTALRVRAWLSPVDGTMMRKFEMQSAELQQSSSDRAQATWIEKCTCPHGYQGQFCENCLPGYRREVLNGDASVRCIPCSCNNHSTVCDQQTGKCECMHNTVGDQCENCLDGYYGNALIGSSGDCKKCNCPNDGSCAEVQNYQSNTVDVVCVNCPEGKHLFLRQLYWFYHSVCML